MWILYFSCGLSRLFQFNSTLRCRLNAQIRRIVILIWKSSVAHRKWRKSEQTKNLNVMMDIFKFHTLGKERFSCLSQFWECWVISFPQLNFSEHSKYDSQYFEVLHLESRPFMWGIALNKRVQLDVNWKTQSVVEFFLIIGKYVVVCCRIINKNNVLASCGERFLR